MSALPPGAHEENGLPEEVSLKIAGKGTPPLTEENEYNPAGLDLKEAYFLIRQLDELAHLPMKESERASLREIYLEDVRTQIEEMKNPEAVGLLRKKLEEFEKRKKGAQ
jgi:hypothetical protein